MLNVGEVINERTAQCSDFNWVFDYNYQSKDSNPLKTKKSKMVSCKNVIYAIHIENGDNRKDYALIKLDRKMEGRHHFIPRDKEVSFFESVAIMGHPSGLPLKYAAGANVQKVHPEKVFFEATIDAVGGNSGSPVIDRKGKLLGILVRGNVDFAPDRVMNCDRWNKCSSNGKRCTDGIQESDYDSGMHVQKITPHIRELIKKHRGN
jgi:V8-like Glu-specific endopeptidase